MRLNCSSLNARPLNGAQRLAVQGAAEAIAGFGASLEGLRTVRAAGAAQAQLTAVLSPSAARFARMDAAFDTQIEIHQSVYRGARGAATITTTGILYFERKVLGFGGAGVFLSMQGNVGVVFIDGAATTHPLISQLDGTRVRRSSATAAASLSGALSGAAIRRATAQAPNDLALVGELDPTHLHDGVRYITAGAAPSLSLSSVDAGMRRQTLLGSIDFYNTAVGAGRLKKPTLAGIATIALTLEADFRVYRRLAGSGVLAARSTLDGEVFVRGAGEAALRLGAAGTGYAVKRNNAGSATLRLLPTMDGLRAKSMSGTAAAVFSAALSAGRWRTGRGRTEIVLPAVAASPSAIRNGQGVTRFVHVANMTADALVPGAADFAAEIALEGTGYATKFDMAGDLVLSIFLEPTGARRRAASGGAVLEQAVEATGARRITFVADAAIEVLAPAGGYVNIYAEDASEQQFYRPGVEREFLNPGSQRIFTRAA